MAVYCLVFSRESEWDDDPKNHFSTREAANHRLAEVEATGQFAKLVRWEAYKGREPKEVARVNDNS